MHAACLGTAPAARATGHKVQGAQAGGPEAWTGSRPGSRWWAGSEAGEAGRRGLRQGHRDEAGRAPVRDTGRQDRHEGEREPARAEEDSKSKFKKPIKSKPKDTTSPKKPPKLVMQLFLWPWLLPKTARAVPGGVGHTLYSSHHYLPGIHGYGILYMTPKK